MAALTVLASEHTHDHVCVSGHLWERAVRTGTAEADMADWCSRTAYARVPRVSEVEVRSRQESEEAAGWAPQEETRHPLHRGVEPPEKWKGYISCHLCMPGPWEAEVPTGGSCGSRHSP